jgi:hypothetical protein
MSELTFAAWLRLREPADAAARATTLVEPIRRHLAGTARAVVHDLGCGTGSMARWLAPQLPGPQHWILYDQDPDLLEQAAIEMPAKAADDALVTVETRLRDVTRLRTDDLAGASLVTASALLDLLTAEEIDRIVAACVAAGHPVLMTLSVIGRVRFSPADPLDPAITAAFNAHQRRTTGGRRLLGPDAVQAAVDAFARHGIAAQVDDSHWQLEADDADLIGEWFAGWLDAACEQHPQLAVPARDYARRRYAQLADATLAVTVGHRDLLALCGRPGQGAGPGK